MWLIIIIRLNEQVLVELVMNQPTHAHTHTLTFTVTEG